MLSIVEISHTDNFKNNMSLVLFENQQFGLFYIFNIRNPKLHFNSTPSISEYNVCCKDVEFLIFIRRLLEKVFKNLLFSCNNRRTARQ